MPTEPPGLCGEPLGPVRTCQQEPWGGGGGCCVWKDIVISGKVLSCIQILGKLGKDVSHDYRIGLHFQAVTPIPGRWMGGWNTEPDCNSIQR